MLIIARETVDGLAASSIKRGDNNTDSHHLQAKTESLFFCVTTEEQHVKQASPKPKTLSLSFVCLYIELNMWQ